MSGLPTFRVGIRTPRAPPEMAIAEPVSQSDGRTGFLGASGHRTRERVTAWKPWAHVRIVHLLSRSTTIELVDDTRSH